MARPLRIEHPGGWYHITSRGNERRAVFRADRDRIHFWELLAEMPQRFVSVNRGASSSGEQKRHSILL